MKNRIFFILLLLFSANCIKAQQDFPSITLKSVSGKLINLNDLVNKSKDTIVVVSFWATWCVPCISELDNINDVYLEKQVIKPFKFYGVAIDDSRTAQRVKPFIKGKGWQFDVLMDINSELKRALNITDVPHLILLKDGRIAYRHTGYIAGEEENLFETIKDLK
jgi:thiol-disulfide isomerase/thioredoxin